MVIVTLGDIITLIFIFLLIVVVIVNLIKSWLDSIFKQNCFECKHYYLQDVAGAGDCCWHNCRLHDEYHKDRHSMNDSVEYRKCKDFEKKSKGNNNE